MRLNTKTVMGGVAFAAAFVLLASSVLADATEQNTSVMVQNGEVTITNGNASVSTNIASVAATTCPTSVPTPTTGLNSSIIVSLNGTSISIVNGQITIVKADGNCLAPVSLVAIYRIRTESAPASRERI